MNGKSNSGWPVGLLLVAAAIWIAFRPHPHDLVLNSVVSTMAYPLRVADERSPGSSRTVLIPIIGKVTVPDRILKTEGFTVSCTLKPDFTPLQKEPPNQQDQLKTFFSTEFNDALANGTWKATLSMADALVSPADEQNFTPDGEARWSLKINASSKTKGFIKIEESKKTQFILPKTSRFADLDISLVSPGVAWHNVISATLGLLGGAWVLVPIMLQARKKRIQQRQERERPRIIV